MSGGSAAPITPITTAINALIFWCKEMPEAHRQARKHNNPNMVEFTIKAIVGNGRRKAARQIGSEPHKGMEIMKRATLYNKEAG